MDRTLHHSMLTPGEGSRTRGGKAMQPASAGVIRAGALDGSASPNSRQDVRPGGAQGCRAGDRLILSQLTPPQPKGLATLPTVRTSGIYFLWNAGLIVYVGQSRDITERVCQHLKDGVKRFDGVSHIEVDLKRLDKVERHFIEKLLPKYNQCGIANAMRLLRRHGYRGTSRTPLRRMNAQQAADFLGISVADVIALPFCKTIVVRIPRANIRRSIRTVKTAELIRWAEENPKKLAELQQLPPSET